MDRDVMNELFKFLPAGAGGVGWAITMNHVIGGLTIVYILVQIAYLARKFYREEKDWRGRPKRKRTEERTA